METPQRNFDSVYRPSGPKIQVFNGTGRTVIQQRPTRKRRVIKVVLWVLALVLAAAVLWLIARSFAISSKIFVGEKGNFFSQLTDVIRGSTGTLSLKGEKQGQINILLLGIGGSGHDGPYLSDTIILAQIRPAEGRVSLTSIPRDYHANLGEFGRRKINAAFAEGYYKNENWDEGGTLSRTAVGELAGLDIPYFAVVDFSGFKTAIDTVGGIDIQVERSFTDYQYPDENNGYLPPVTFKEGLEHMNGSRALIFSRSRHASGPEGSDFARSQRQHKVIQAFKDQAVSLNLVTDIGTVNELLSVFADHFHTNLSAGELLHLYKLTKDFSSDNVATTSLDPATGLVCSDILEESGAYIVVPCPGKTKADIHHFFVNSFLLGKVAREKAVVWVATTNPNSRAYKQTEAKLAGYGVTVWPLKYDDVTPEQSVVYAVNQKPATFEYITSTLEAREVTVPPPNLKIDAARSDIIVILGSNLKLDPSPPTP